MLTNLQTTETAPAVTVGTPVYRDGYGICEKGFVAEIKGAAGNVYSLGRGRMDKVRADYLIAWERLSVTEVSDQIAAQWVETAARYEIAPISEAEVLDLLRRGREADAAELAKREQERRDHEDRVQAFRDKYRDKIPADAVAVLVAELERDDSDSMTDYFNTVTEKTVLLAFSTHTRNNFAEMR
jgi:phosphoglycolate phosphatase-like HAD superfamily hydrolase